MDNDPTEKLIIIETKNFLLALPPKGNWVISHNPKEGGGLTGTGLKGKLTYQSQFATPHWLPPYTVLLYWLPLSLMFSSERRESKQWPISIGKWWEPDFCIHYLKVNEMPIIN